MSIFKQRKHQEEKPDELTDEEVRQLHDIYTLFKKNEAYRKLFSCFHRIISVGSLVDQKHYKKYEKSYGPMRCFHIIRDGLTRILGELTNVAHEVGEVTDEQRRSFHERV